MTTRICGAWLGFPWISLILGDFMWISWIPRGSGAPGLMTGSAGTAMDVLVTCFSKKGGGSGRRGCKGLLRYLISVHDMDTYSVPRRVSKSMAGAILWTHLGKKRKKSAAF